jgi:hypothetical protein
LDLHDFRLIDWSICSVYTPVNKIIYEHPRIYFRHDHDMSITVNCSNRNAEYGTPHAVLISAQRRECISGVGHNLGQCPADDRLWDQFTKLRRHTVVDDLTRFTISTYLDTQGPVGTYLHNHYQFINDGKR